MCYAHGSINNRGRNHETQERRTVLERRPVQVYSEVPILVNTPAMEVLSPVSEPLSATAMSAMMRAYSTRPWPCSSMKIELNVLVISEYYRHRSAQTPRANFSAMIGTYVVVAATSAAVSLLHYRSSNRRQALTECKASR